MWQYMSETNGDERKSLCDMLVWLVLSAVAIVAAGLLEAGAGAVVVVVLNRRLLALP